MSASRDTRESGEEAAAPAVPGDSAPPSFGAATPPADPPPEADREPAEAAEPAESSDTLRLPPFGLQAPWWAAESTETGPPEEDAAPADVSPAGDTATDDTPEDDTPEEGSPAAPRIAAVPPGTLVAGVGVPKIDSRGAVPATPIVKRSPASGDTDPDGFPAVRPDGERPGDTAAEPADTEPTGSEPTDIEPADTEPDAPETGTATEDAAETDTVTDIPAVTVSKESGTAEADTTVDIPAVKDEAEEHADEAAQDGRPSAFERARAAEDASTASAGPVLVPDAILPAGVTPPTGSGPFPHTEPAAAEADTAPHPTVITPVYHAEGGIPLDGPTPPGQPPQDAPQDAPQDTSKGASKGSGRTKRRLALVGGGAAVILAAGAALFAIGGTGSDGDRAGEAKAVESPAATQSTPPPSPTASPQVTPTTPVGPPSRIDHERTDRKPLAFQDVFPTKTIRLGGRTFTRDRWSLNRDASYAARGSMLQALERERCRKIIRATFIDRSTSLAVTSGIAVMPTKEAALKVSRAGNPARYEWFRGMGGENTPNLDRAGGYAAATVRGRYVAYAYVQWANGKPARPGDPVIKQAAQRFLDYDLRPIVDRARR